MQVKSVWDYKDDSWSGTDITGYGVEAVDGSIGKIDNASNEVGASRIVVDTGPWIFGKKVMLPVGVIERVDANEEKVYVERTKDQIKDAPEYDDAFFNDERYRGEIGSYYGEGGLGYRNMDDRG